MALLGILDLGNLKRRTVRGSGVLLPNDRPFLVSLPDN